MTKLIGLVTVFLCTAFAWQTHRLVIVPEPWGCPDAPHMGGGDIYSPEIVRFRTKHKLYFGGWLEQCRLADAIYVAEYNIPTNTLTDITLAIDPLTVGLQSINDPTIATVRDRATDSRMLRMYFTGVPDGVDVHDITSNKIYTTTSSIRDGWSWSRPELLLDGWWAPGAVQHPGTRHIWVWANSTETGEFRAFEFDTDGISLLSSYPTLLPPGANYDNMDARWDYDLHGWDILAENINRPDRVIERLFSPDGILFILVEQDFLIPDDGFMNITPSWGPGDIILYGKYLKTWPPDSSVWRIDEVN